MSQTPLLVSEKFPFVSERSSPNTSLTGIADAHSVHSSTATAVNATRIMVAIYSAAFARSLVLWLSLVPHTQFAAQGCHVAHKVQAMCGP